MNKKNLGETFVVFTSELTQTQNKDVQKVFKVPVSNTPAIQQETEITQIVPETLFATPTLQEIFDKMISRMMKIENNVSKMQTYVTAPNLQYLHLPYRVTNFDIWSTTETTQTLFDLSKVKFPCIR